MNRREVLESAIKCVCHDRQDQHGNPEDTFAMIADMWEMYLCHKYGIDVSISPSDVAWMMTLLKVARSAKGIVKDDDFVDACGYSALAGELSGNRIPQSPYTPRKYDDEYNDCTKSK